MAGNCYSSNSSLPSASKGEIQHFLCLYQCYDPSAASAYIISSFTITSVTFLLPVYVFILHLGFKQWRQRNFSTVAMSHFDLFTYHMVLFELLGVFVHICIFCSLFNENTLLMWITTCLSVVSQSGQLLLHSLTCAERHLAVVHPIIYRSMKGERWITARNAIIIFVWLLSSLMLVGFFLPRNRNIYLATCIPVAFMLFYVLVLCLSVLRVLMRSGPGGGKGGKLHVDQSKLRAFYVIVGVLVVLVLKLSWHVFSGSMIPFVGQTVRCALLSFGFWTGMPSSLLLPLLYLRRKGKWLCCKK